MASRAPRPRRWRRPGRRPPSRGRRWGTPAAAAARCGCSRPRRRPRRAGSAHARHGGGYLQHDSEWPGSMLACLVTALRRVTVEVGQPTMHARLREPRLPTTPGDPLGTLHYTPALITHTVKLLISDFLRRASLSPYPHQSISQVF